MREIEKQMNAAISARRNFKRGNTEVEVSNGSIFIYLHGNCICQVAPGGGRRFKSCGWDTPTTRSRLNALGCACRISGGEIIPTGSTPIGVYSFPA